MRNVVFTNGAFDIIHPGHLRIFSVCRQLAGPGGKVIVGLNSDTSVKRLKGPFRPVNAQDHRREVLTALRDVDEVRIFSEDTPYELISSIRPDVVVKGADYAGSPHSYLTGPFLCPVVTVPLLKDRDVKVSTSGVILAATLEPAPCCCSCDGCRQSCKGLP